MPAFETKPGTATGSPALELIGVTITALHSPDRVVLRDVNWRIDTGDFWVVAGLHHSGKSDLMCLVAGLMPPHAGTRRIFGERLGMSPEQASIRLRLGLVFDGGQLLSHLTVRQNIALPLLYHRSSDPQGAESAVNSLLELTELTPWADRLPNDVGRNWRQRAGLARALALRPEVLLLDSPLTGLDPVDTQWWTDLLGALSRGHSIVDGRPLTLVATADDLRPWRRLANRFAILQNQRFVAIEPDTVCTVPDEALLQQLLGRRTTRA